MSGDVFEWLEASRLAVCIRQSHLLFPIIEVVHIVGFILLTGGAFLFDLRLLGVSQKISVQDAARYVLPWSRRSLFLVIPSGMLLFISQAKSLSTNSLFGIKLVLIFLAFINAGYFHLFSLAKIPDGEGVTVPAAAKVNAVVSIILWAAVISCGRLIAYF